LVRSRRAVNRLYGNKAQISSVSMRLGEIIGMNYCFLWASGRLSIWIYQLISNIRLDESPSYQQVLQLLVNIYDCSSGTITELLSLFHESSLPHQYFFGFCLRVYFYKLESTVRSFWMEWVNGCDTGSALRIMCLLHHRNFCITIWLWVHSSNQFWCFKWVQDCWIIQNFIARIQLLLNYQTSIHQPIQYHGTSCLH